MSFQPLPDTGPEKPKLADFGLFVIRSLTVAAFFYYQLASHLISAKSFIWDVGEWDLVAQLEAKGLPMPDIFAVSATILLAISLLGVGLGFFTRFNSLLATLIIGFVLIAPITLSATLNPQTLALYLAVFAGLTFGGAGRLSLDNALQNHRERRRKPS
jgi:uncharacterized membrane protein YphA (DoxX/SURF4 family)